MRASFTSVRTVVLTIVCVLLGVGANSGSIAAAPGQPAERLSIRNCAPASRTALPGDMDQVMDSVVIVQNGNRIGSGVVISPDGFVLTAAHVVGNAQSVGIYLRSGETTTGQVMRVQGNQDMALLKMSGEDFQCLPIRRKAPVIGSRVYGVGVSLAGNLDFEVIPARVDAYRPSDGTLYMHTGAMELMPGNSGGPLLNARGEVIGIISGKIVRPDAETLSVSAAANRVEQAMRVQLSAR